MECGVPQGSLLSKLLLMLHTTTFFQDVNGKNIFGYADDIAIVNVERAAAEAERSAQVEFNIFVKR